jgi:hypothetical protein
MIHATPMTYSGHEGQGLLHRFRLTRNAMHRWAPRMNLARCVKLFSRRYGDAVPGSGGHLPTAAAGLPVKQFNLTEGGTIGGGRRAYSACGLESPGLQYKPFTR